MGLVLLISVILLVIGGVPNLGLHSYGWGLSGIGGVLLLILILLLLTGRL